MYMRNFGAMVVLGDEVVDGCVQVDNGSEDAVHQASLDKASHDSVDGI